MISSIVFNSIAGFLILLIVIWFWFTKDKSTKALANGITIRVKDGVYSPSRIQTSQKNLILNFIREDASPCSEYVLFESLNVHARLPLNESHKITLNNLKPGLYRFTCQMGMYQGELVVTRT